MFYYYYWFGWWRCSHDVSYLMENKMWFNFGELFCRSGSFQSTDWIQYFSVCKCLYWPIVKVLQNGIFTIFELGVLSSLADCIDKKRQTFFVDLLKNIICKYWSITWASLVISRSNFDVCFSFINTSLQVTMRRSQSVKAVNSSPLSVASPPIGRQRNRSISGQTKSHSSPSTKNKSASSKGEML